MQFKAFKNPKHEIMYKHCERYKTNLKNKCKVDYNKYSFCVLSHEYFGN